MRFENIDMGWMVEMMVPAANVKRLMGLVIFLLDSLSVRACLRIPPVL